MKWADGKIRCCWANPRNERYIRYHDEEWGVCIFHLSSASFPEIQST